MKFNIRNEYLTSTLAALFVLALTAKATSAFGTPSSGNHNNFYASLLYSQEKPVWVRRRIASSLTTPSLARVRGGANQDGFRPRRTFLSLAAATTSTTLVSAENLAVLSDRGRAALERLVEFDRDTRAQQHVYGQWPVAGTDDEGKRRLAEQLADLDASYPGGLTTYLAKAQQLLKESADGVNTFADYEAAVPEGERLSLDGTGTMSLAAAEQAGLSVSGTAVFVLVAGGLGERLGYSGIKLSLETNLCTNICYLEFYIKYIQALQHCSRRHTKDETIRIPLVIMTSGDTDSLTRKLLEENNNFGMDKDLLTIVTQDKVAALKDGSAGLALDDADRWKVQTKPHGHGDVHHLLQRDGLVDQWQNANKTHVVFLQDTNALVINSILPGLGVSVTKGFHMNSLCIPRLAGEAAGAIARLEHKTDPSKTLVINVEYNQLDPLLRTQGDCQGDVPDPETGYSPFPGNANNLILELSAYARTLRGEDQGVVLEFVNPKYKDSSRTDFKKPTRLECMMQDIPKLFQKEMGSDVDIGFTMFDRWFTFSPAKNSLESGQDAVRKDGWNAGPCTMSSAESDMYIQNQRKLAFAGAQLNVTQPPEDVSLVAGIPVTLGPRVILCPAFGITQEEYREKIHDLTLSDRSSLVLDGHYLTIKNLRLDGALVIRTGEDSHVTVDGLVVENKGWELRELDPTKEYPEHVRIRGYTMLKHDTCEYIIDTPGNFVIDASGQVQKVE